MILFILEPVEQATAAIGQRVTVVDPAIQLPPWRRARLPHLR